MLLTKTSNQNKHRVITRGTILRVIAVVPAASLAGLPTGATMIYFHNSNTRNDRNPNVAPAGARNVGAIVIKRIAPKNAYTGADTWRKKGSMMGGRGGSCAGVTGGNGIGVVPQAFIRIG